MRIWELNPTPNKFLCVNPVDLHFFNDRFDGDSLASKWSTPDYTFLNRSKNVADFTSWQIGKAILVTERARNEILDLCGDDVEFLRFDIVKGKVLYAANVLRVEDFLDREQTQFMPGVGIVQSAVFRRDLPDKLPEIFKAVPADKSPIYVTELFGRMLVNAKLSGARLRDPAKIALQQVIRGEEMNVFPGL